MKPIRLLYIFFLMYFFSSCVPYKKIVYVQGDLKQEKATEKDYKIQKDDILYIKINSSNELVSKIFDVDKAKTANMGSQTLFFSGYTVDNEGNIELPVIKKIHVEGKTFEQVKQMIKQKMLSTQFKTVDDIFIKVKLAGVPYTIVGEVKQPHTGVLYKVNPDIFDVLSDSGDITLVGNRNEVVVMRKENGKLVKNTLDLTSADVVNSPYFHIRPNDIIYVKPLRQKVLGTGTTLRETISATITAFSLLTTIILYSRLIKQ